MYILGADIGGTNARLALAQIDAAGWQLCHQQVLATADYPQLSDLLAEFLHNQPAPDTATLAIAGPVLHQAGDTTASLTNVDWQIRCSQLKQQCDIPRLELMNDFAAIAWALPVLQPEQLHLIKPGQADTSRPMALLGAGTGLGQAMVTCGESTASVFPSEGGHSDFAPLTPTQKAVCDQLQQRFQHVSVERLLSGPGLENIYQALSTDSDCTLTAAEISIQGMSGEDRLAQRTLEIFAEVYGAHAGNIALHYMAEGGVYLAGGVTSKLAQYLSQSKFIECFLDKGRFGDYLERIPVYVIQDELAGLTGALQRAWSSHEFTYYE